MERLLRGRWVGVRAGVLLALALLLAPDRAQAQATCQRSYAAIQDGGRQLLVDSLRVNPGNVCGWSTPILVPGSQIRVNNVQVNGPRTITYPDGTVIEKDAAAVLWITPGPGVRGPLVLFGTPASGAAPVRARDAVAGEGVVTLVMAGTNAANPNYFLVTVDVRPAAVSAPEMIASATRTTLVAGGAGTVVQRFGNPNGFELVVDQTSVASGAVRWTAAASDCTGEAAASDTALAVRGLRLPSGGSCTVTGTLQGTAVGAGAVTPGPPSGLGRGTRIDGAAPGAIALAVRAVAAPPRPSA